MARYIRRSRSRSYGTRYSTPRRSTRGSYGGRRSTRRTSRRASAPRTIRIVVAQETPRDPSMIGMKTVAPKVARF